MDRDKALIRKAVERAAERKITFRQVNDPDAAEVFRKWEQSENKIPY